MKKVDIIDKEMKEEGKIPITLWCTFYNYGCSFAGIFFIIFFSSASIFFNIFINFVVGYWAEKDEDEQENPWYFVVF
jgi:hypothetical protein